VRPRFSGWVPVGVFDTGFFFPSQILFEGFANDGIWGLVLSFGEAIYAIIEIAVEFEVDRHVEIPPISYLLNSKNDLITEPFPSE
jgi:hypothetical protein